MPTRRLPKAKITRVRIYRPPNLNPLFNQSNMVVTVETDIGITGIGEGGAKDTLEQCAGTLIGKNPFRIEAIWQEAYIAWFYPPGREKAHALGALDLALWDIKGKALGVPVHELLGGIARDYCECYATGGAPPGTSPDREAEPQASARARRSRRAIARSGWAPATFPSADVYDTRSIVRASSRSAARRARASDPTATGASTSTSASTSTTPCAAARRSSPTSRSSSRIPCATSTPWQDIPKLRQMTDGAADARRGVGPAVGLQPAGREPRRRLHPRRPCPTSAGSPR